MDNAPVLLLSEPELAVVDKFAIAERLALAAVLATLAAVVAAWFIPALDRAAYSSWRPMHLSSVLAALVSALSLHFSGPGFGRRIRNAGRLLAVCVALACTVAFIAGRLLHPSAGVDAGVADGQRFWTGLLTQMSPESASAFALLGMTLVLIPARGRTAGLVADGFTFCLVLLVLTLVSAHFLGSVQLFGVAAPTAASSATMLCLLLLTAVAFFRRARRGVFSILLGRGIGSRIARVLSPVLLVLPYLREAVRARLIGWQRMPSDYATATMATMIAVILLVLLFYLAWRINQMETEIHDLSLRDPLTGLYNLRGFRLLAEQALLLAHRSGQPFSVLFIDLDNLKQTNDELGHQAGSDFLVETAGILESAFRETDVLGRIGGDEFAAAGQFSNAAIALAAQRLEDALAQRNAAAARHIDLSFSVGYITSEFHPRASLDELLALADQAMYEEKRRRKAVFN